MKSVDCSLSAGRIVFLQSGVAGESALSVILSLGWISKQFGKLLDVFHSMIGLLCQRMGNLL